MRGHGSGDRTSELGDPEGPGKIIGRAAGGKPWGSKSIFAVVTARGSWELPIRYKNPVARGIREIVDRQGVLC